MANYRERPVLGTLCCGSAAERRILAADTWAAQRCIFAQMFQFWRCLTNQTTHHPIGRAVADHSLQGTALPDPELVGHCAVS